MGWWAIIGKAFKAIGKGISKMGKGMKSSKAFAKAGGDSKFVKGMSESNDMLKGIKAGGLNPLNKIMSLMQKVGIAEPFVGIMSGWTGMMQAGAVSSYAFQDALRDFSSTLQDPEFQKWLGETGNLLASITGPIMKGVGAIMKTIVAGVGQAWSFLKKDAAMKLKLEKQGVHSLIDMINYSKQMHYIAAVREKQEEARDLAEESGYDAFKRTQALEAGETVITTPGGETGEGDVLGIQYHYDPETGITYTQEEWNNMQININIENTYSDEFIAQMAEDMAFLDAIRQR